MHGGELLLGTLSIYMTTIIVIVRCIARTLSEFLEIYMGTLFRTRKIATSLSHKRLSAEMAPRKLELQFKA
jgi:hypothetical protein